MTGYRPRHRQRGRRNVPSFVALALAAAGGAVLVTTVAMAAATVTTQVLSRDALGTVQAPGTSATPTATPVPSAAPVPASPASTWPAPAPSPSTRPRVLTIGDSIMKGYGVNPDQAWPSLIAAQQGWTLINRACNGAGFITAGVNDCGENFAGVVGEAAGLQPDVVIVSGSSNDFGTDNTELLKATAATLNQIRAEFPQARIIGLSTTWGDIPEPSEVSIIDSQLKDALAGVGGTFVDVGQPLSGHPELMQDDHIHPNQQGQVTLQLAIERALAGAHALI